jgi:hypothetical protein
MKSNSKTITEKWLRTYIENKVESDPNIINPDDAKELLWGTMQHLIGKQLEQKRKQDD